MHITSFTIEECVCGALPQELTYNNTDDSWQPWLAPKDALWFVPNDTLIAIHFKPGEQSDIEVGKTTFWVFGKFTYLDVLGNVLSHRFVPLGFAQGFHSSEASRIHGRA